MKRWGIVILVVVSLWVAGASGQQRQVAAPVQRWEYAELVYSRGINQLIWTAPRARVKGDPGDIIAGLGGQGVDGATVIDVTNEVGRRGWELVSNGHDKPDFPVEMWFKRPTP